MARETPQKARAALAAMASRLYWTRAMTGAAILWERVWPRALPALLVASLFLSLSWLGIFRLGGEYVRQGAAVLFLLAFVASLWPLRGIRRPAPAEIDRRIERANALLHAPVSTQKDRLVGDGEDVFAAALWREHQKRMAGQLDRLGFDLPRTDIPERDPWGVRAAIALLLVTAFAFSYGPLGGRVSDAFTATPGVPPIPPRIDAWVTPPAYTGRAPIYLTAEANAGQDLFVVPAGSEAALRITGGNGGETMVYMHQDGTTALEPADPVNADASGRGSLHFATELEHDGVLALMEDDSSVRSWNFQVIPDNPPLIRFAEEPRRAVNGTLDLRYEVEDDHGVTAARAEFEQAGDVAAEARPLYDAPDMPLTLPRQNGRDIAARTTRDLTEHPWAGTQVDITLVAMDGAEQEGRSETMTAVLPERPFSNPLARALIEQRRLLALDANAKGRVLRLMEALTIRPDETFDNASHYLGIASARTRLHMAETQDQLRGIVDYLWEMALGIEDGALSDAERRLRQAQEALRQALEDGASDEEIEQLMAELRDAMNQYLREFAERAMRDPNFAQQMPQQGGQEMRQSDLDRMLDQIEELARSGARDQAQQMLSQLQDMMNNLQMGQGQQGEGGQQGEMRQQMDQLGDLMRRQQQMMNETFQLDQMQRGQGRQPGEFGQEPGQGGGQGGQMSPEEFAEAMRQLQEGQGQLQQELQELMQGLEGMGIQPGEGFGEAGDAMGRAEGALGESQGERAVGEQGQALEALRRGAQDMMQQMQQAMEGEQGEGEGGREGGRQRNADRDPLGRPRATSGPDFGDSVEVPDEIDMQRARQILQEIRRRLGNALSPELERDYLERLLQMR